MTIIDLRTWEAPRTSFMEDEVTKQWESFSNKLSESWIKDIAPLVEDYKDRVREMLEAQFENTIRATFAKYQSETRSWYTDTPLDATNEWAINMLHALIGRFVIDIRSISKDLFQDPNSPRHLEFYSEMGLNVQDHREKMWKFTLDCTNFIQAIQRLYTDGTLEENSFWIQIAETSSFKGIKNARWSKYSYASKYNDSVELLSFAFYSFLPQNNTGSNEHFSNVFYELTKWYFEDIVNYIVLDGKRRGRIDGRA